MKNRRVCSIPRTCEYDHRNGEGKGILKKMYPVDKLKFSFYQGWLERFKSRHDIITYRSFEESKSIDMEM